MPLPRFSLRTTLLAVTASSVLFLVLAKGASGRAWFIGMAAGGASVLVILSVHAAFYGAFTLLGRWLGVEEIVARTSRGAIVRTTTTETNALSEPPV